jgi:GNAT superfamily N-acetyltransferase
VSHEVLSHQFNKPRVGDIREGPTSAIVSQYEPGRYYLRNLSTVPEQRGRGLGTKFMHGLLAEHDKAGTSLTLHTARPELEKWYGSMGFQSEGEDIFGTRMTRKPRTS